ncbi:MAG: hypothetical protein KUG78_13955 [Kangiellaceae bacterium]|nr:hypothetical protein [Kangiellaceae bacterium]
MTSTPNTASIDSYDIKRLMGQTRKLAADYRRETGHVLPVTEELARFDAVNILGLRKVDSAEGIDARDNLNSNDSNDVGYLIKGRVIFKGGKARQKLGKLSLNTTWNRLLMVIYDSDYLPIQVYSVDREIIDNEMAHVNQDKRGSMTVAKYKAIGKLVWSSE